MCSSRLLNQASKRKLCPFENLRNASFKGLCIVYFPTLFAFFKFIINSYDEHLCRLSMKADMYIVYVYV